MLGIGILVDYIKNARSVINKTMIKKWVTNAGNEIPYRELETGHLVNILKWIERKAKDGITLQYGGGGPDPEDMWYDEQYIEGKEVFDKYDYKGLKKELDNRENNPPALRNEDLTEAKTLFDKGYRVISRNYGHISRVDITEKEMVEFFIKENFGDSKSGVAGSSIESQKDFYRRCISKDKLIVRPYIIKLIKKLENNE